MGLGLMFNPVQIEGSDKSLPCYNSSVFPLNPNLPKNMLRKFSLQAGNLLRSVPKTKAIPSPSLVRLADSTRSGLRLYSSKSDSPCNDGDDVDSQELKRRIDKFYEGDADALPSLFEAILKRKLSGKHEESDDELIKDLQEKLPIADAEDEETDSDMDSDGSDQEVGDSDTSKQRRGRDE